MLEAPLYCRDLVGALSHECDDPVQGLLEVKVTHRPEEGPMLLGINLP